MSRKVYMGVYFEIYIIAFLCFVFSRIELKKESKRLKKELLAAGSKKVEEEETKKDLGKL